MARRQIILDGVAPPPVTASRYDKRFNKLRREAETTGMYPLDAPGMPTPPPGGCFVSLAQGLGDRETSIETKTREGKKVTDFTPGELLRELYLEALRKATFQCKVPVGPHREQLASFVPGHIWGQFLNSPEDRAVDGPHPADVMIIGKMPWKEEVRVGRNLWGETGNLLSTLLAELRIRGFGNWYVTNVLKFMPPDGSTRIKSSWLKDCMPLLHQELRIVRPKYILCLGTDASKALLGTKYSVSHMEGRVEEFSFSTAFEQKDPDGDRTHTAKVMTVVHPAQVARDPSTRRQLERGLGRFGQLIRGADPSADEGDLDHRVLDNIPDLFNTLVEIECDPEFRKTNVIAVDAEWHGEHPINDGSYLRTIQFSWLPKKAAGVRLTGPGGAIVFEGGVLNGCMGLLRAFFCGGKFNGCLFRKKRVVGHFFNADLEWLVHYGLDLRKEFATPLYDLEMTDEAADSPRQKHYASLGFEVGDCVPAWFRTKYEGGADTGLMAHAIEETAQYKLESLAIRYTSCPRYDSDLSDWKTAYCKENNFSSKDLEGYGECPDEVLLPYGIYDADVTLRLFYEFDVLLDKDYEGNNCREAFWESQIAAPAVLEIHQTGVLLDMERVESLTRAFLGAREEKVEKLRELIHWPEFNPRSLIHVKEFLYGVRLNGKKTSTGEPVRVGPEDALRLNLEPLFDTSKPPKSWMDIKVRGKEDEHNPSTSKQTLAMIAQDAYDVRYALDSTLTASDYINMLRDFRFLDQVVKTVLRPPEMDEEGEFVRDDSEELIYKEGLAGHLCSDGRVRTHIYQTMETGRWASARPNLQNISKSRDNDYKRLLGDRYKTKLRTIMCSSPGHVFVEADYIGAELFGMAIMSNDHRMIDHAKRNQLGEEHPEFYDIHSNVAKMSFGLECAPTKSGMAAIEKSHLRIVAKSVIFGIAYGRGAKAIAMAAKEQGIDVTVDDAQRIIDTIFMMYPGLKPFFAECQARATRELRSDGEGHHEGWLVSCFGRYRRFPVVPKGDRGLEGEFGRQAMNFPIQSMIASAVSRAMGYLYQARVTSGDPDLFKIILQIHDAVLLEVPYANVKYVCEEVLPFAMRECVPIHPTDLNGKSISREPYYLGIEADMMSHWGEKLSQEKAEEMGLPIGTFVKDGMVVNYT